MDCAFALKAALLSVIPHGKGSDNLTSILLEKMEVGSKSSWLGKAVFPEQTAHTVKQRQLGLAGTASAVGGCFISPRLLCVCVHYVLFLEDIQHIYGRSPLMGRGEPMARAEVHAFGNYSIQERIDV